MKMGGMNAYFVAMGEAVTGPFGEGQLLVMWRAGAITADALVCLEGTEDWRSIADEVAAIEALNVPMQQQRRAAMMARYAGIKSKRCHPGTAALLSVLLVGAGHMYAGETGRGLLFLAAALGCLFTGLWPLGIVVLLIAVFDAMRAAREANEIV